MSPLHFKGRLCLFDVTISETLVASVPQLAALANDHFKRWVFQKEKGKQTGYVHYQFRGSLHKKVSEATIYKDVLPYFPGDWSVTSTEVHDSGNQFNYVMKTDTRLDGPWSDKDNVRPPPVLTRQLERFMTLNMYPWQTELASMVTMYNERRLSYIYDPHYNSGKSIMCEYLEYKGLAEEIPPFTLMEDIIQFVMSMPVSTCYLFDMPAAMKKERMHQMYSGLEMLKNGYLYEKRYHGKKRRIDRPNVICFANSLPQLDLMAPDRWTIWYITPRKELWPYDPAIHPETFPHPETHIITPPRPPRSDVVPDCLHHEVAQDVL